MKKKIFLLVFSLLYAGILKAAILNVPADYATIQAGIDAANTHDTVLVDTGTYVENINYNGKNITVASLFLTTVDTSYISQTIIDGDSLDSVVKFVSGEDSTAVLCGFTITNGYADHPYQYGGGIYCAQNSSPTLRNLLITLNYSNGSGGGISCRNGSNAHIKDLEISDNFANHFGGGLSCYEASPLISNVLISGNYAEFWGGGIYCKEYSSPQLNNVVIKNNAAVFCGGGLSIYSNSSPHLVYVKILNNNCCDDEGIGGGIICCNSSLNILSTTISENTASHGGAIYCGINSNVEICGSYFLGNISYCNAGCILCDHSNMVLKNCLINNSDAFSYGGGMYVYNDSYVIMDSVSLISNVSSVGGGINIENSTLDSYNG
ncbi:MAG: hypothetical protein H8D22_04855, partial [Candidatus Cloacimonetes bacterium]|nr:hypothetical protein [Candidatus Cloacimonadota bacterium]